MDLAPGDDTDGDGLTNLEDYTLGTPPLVADADGDGILDGDELFGNGTHGDSDGYVTDPHNPDSDGDGFEDGWEVQYGFDPTSANETLADSDGDGFADLYEYYHGSDPLDAQSLPVFSPTQTGAYHYYVVDGSLGSETTYEKRTITAVVNAASAYDIVEVKAGVYNQNNSGEPDDYVQATFYALKATH